LRTRHGDVVYLAVAVHKSERKLRLVSRKLLELLYAVAADAGLTISNLMSASEIWRFVLYSWKGEERIEFSLQ